MNQTIKNSLAQGDRMLIGGMLYVGRPPQYQVMRHPVTGMMETVRTAKGIPFVRAERRASNV